jgi:hypothetical protein
VGLLGTYDPRGHAKYHIAIPVDQSLEGLQVASQRPLYERAVGVGI